MAWNPSVNDMSGQIRLQGAQMLGQGIQQFAGGIANGIEAWKKKEEENKDIAAKGKSAAQFLQNFGKELGFGEEQLNQFLTKSADETDRQYALRVSSGLKEAMTLPEIRKAAAAAQASNAQSQLYQTQLKQLQDELNKKDQQVNYLKGIAQFATGTGSGVLRGDVQDQMNSEIQKNPFVVRAAQAYRATGEVPSAATLINDTSRAEIAAARNETELAKREAANAAKVVPKAEPGYELFTDPKTGQTTARPIPGSKAEQEQAKTNQEMQKEADKAAASAKAVQDRELAQKRDIQETIKNVNDAIFLSRQGAGGPIDNLAAYIPGLAPLTDQLQSKLDSIRSSMKLLKLADMKSMSPTGSSGMGQLSDKEGAALEQSVAKLSSGKREKYTEEDLKRIKDYLMRLGGVPAQGQAPKKIGRFEIVTN